jgi:hypothetical protein
MRRLAFRLGLRAVAAAASAACLPAGAVDYIWASGTFASGVTAPNPLPAADTLRIVNGGFKYFSGPGFVFTNNGNVAWETTNAIYMQNGAGVVNNGVWDSTASHTLANNGGGGLSFTNNGTFRSSSAGITVTVQAGTGFVNNGTVDAQAGTITFTGGATFNNGSVFSGAGTVEANGSNTWVGSFSASNLVLNGSSHLGSGATANGMVTLNGGVIDGTWTVAANATLVGGSGSFKYLQGSAVNDGTVRWDTTNAWYLQHGGQFTNNALFTATQSTSMVYNGGAATGFVNSGSGRVRAEAGVALTLGNGIGLRNDGGIFESGAGANITIQGGAQLNGGVYTGPGTITVVNNNGFSGTLTTGNLHFTSGTHTGNGGGATLAGTARWTGGLFVGDWTIGTGSTLTVQDGPFKYFSAANVVNDGSIAWDTTNALYLQNGAVWTNNGSFVASASMSIVNNGGAQPTLRNTATGLIRAAGGATVTIGNMLVNDAGQLDAQAGSVIHYTGGASFNDGTRFTGAGTNRVAGSAVFTGTMHTANLLLQSGGYTGSGAVLDGPTAWTGGQFQGGWTNKAGSTLTVGDGAFKYLDGAAFTNDGTIAWNTSNALYLQGGAVLTNNGLFVSSAGATLANNGGAQPMLLNTAGGVLRSNGGTLHVGNVLRNQGGELAATAGNGIRYTGGGVFDAGTRFTGAGSHVVAGASTWRGAITAAGNLVLESGTQTGDGVVLSGAAAFNGGPLQGTWQFAPGSVVTGGDGAFKYVDGNGTVVDNRGTLIWATTNALYVQGSSQLLNAGTIELRTDTSFVNNGGAPLFLNTGLIRKTQGAGTFNIGNGLSFDNQGTVDVRSGTLALPNNFVNNGRLMGTGTFTATGSIVNAGHVAPGASAGTLTIGTSFTQTAAGFLDIELESLASHDLLLVNGPVTLGGTLAVSCLGNCVLGVGDEVVVLDYTGSRGASTFASLTMSGFASGAFTTIYDDVNTRVLLRVTEMTTPVPEPGTWALWLAGAAALGGVVRRRRAQAPAEGVSSN